MSEQTRRPTYQRQKPAAVGRGAETQAASVSPGRICDRNIPRFCRTWEDSAHASILSVLCTRNASSKQQDNNLAIVYIYGTVPKKYVSGCIAWALGW
jgi:hypothetical protein